MAIDAISSDFASFRRAIKRVFTFKKNMTQWPFNMSGLIKNSTWYVLYQVEDISDVVQTLIRGENFRKNLGGATLATCGHGFMRHSLIIKALEREDEYPPWHHNRQSRVGNQIARQISARNNRNLILTYAIWRHRLYKGRQLANVVEGGLYLKSCCGKWINKDFILTPPWLITKCKKSLNLSFVVNVD